MATDIFSLLFSSYKDYQKQSLIQANQRKSKVGDTTYSLSSVDYNPTTRAAKITFECTKQYRTVERYVTRNYEKHPVYSDWKYKTTYIKKNIKLTNENLEALNRHEDDLISDFAAEIIALLENDDMIPSWLRKEWLRRQWKDEVAKLDDKKNQKKREHAQAVSQANNEIEALKGAVKKAEKKARRPRKKLDRINRKIEKLRARKKSTKREQRLLKKQEKWGQICADVENQINNHLSKVRVIELQIGVLDENFKSDTQKLDNQAEALHQEYIASKKQIQPLITTFQQDNEFIPLKTFMGIKYEKIVGCYVIHNTEKNRYYVGQSKDVMKRLKTHFRGTVPNSMVFAEDYFSSQLKNKDDLYTVKVIRCQTKDELDATEREMIEYYDAYLHGYNGTSGNV